jgi:hypothetical protein
MSRLNFFTECPAHKGGVIFLRYALCALRHADLIDGKILLLPLWPGISRSSNEMAM